MTAVIDRTLSDENVHRSFVVKEHIAAYLEALEVCGTDYIEVGRAMLPFLEGEELSGKYIFRVGSEEDARLCRGRRFAFVSVPYRLSGLIKRLSADQNIIIEAAADEYSAHAVLLHLKSSGLMSHVSMIRLTGFFSSDAAVMNDLVKWFHENFLQSVDICPLNKALTGCVGALGAKNAGADAVTLSFGRDQCYTSLESYYIDTHLLSHTFMPKEIISGICRASTAYMNIFGDLPCGIEQIDALAGRLKTPVCDPELGIVYRPFSAGRKTEEKTHESAVKRKIESMELDSELEKAVLEAVFKAGLLNI